MGDVNMGDWSQYEKKEIKNMKTVYIVERAIGFDKLQPSEAAMIKSKVAQRDIELMNKLRNIFLYKARHATNTARYIAGQCLLSESLVQKVMKGKRSITAEFLGHVCVGLKLSKKETEELFELYGQPLQYNRSLFEAITICAVRDQDDIIDYVDELKMYCSKEEK